MRSIHINWQTPTFTISFTSITETRSHEDRFVAEFSRFHGKSLPFNKLGRILVASACVFHQRRTSVMTLAIFGSSVVISQMRRTFLSLSLLLPDRAFTQMRAFSFPDLRISRRARKRDKTRKLGEEHERSRRRTRKEGQGWID